MSFDTRMYRVAPKFYDDHVGRDLVVGYAVVRRESKSFTEVEMDSEAYYALLADADYYAENMSDPDEVDAYTVAIAKSAARVAAKLRAAGAPDPLPAEVLAEREAGRREQARLEQERADEHRAAERARREAIEHAERVAEAARREREDAIDYRVLIGIENSGRERDGITPADAGRILDERAARQRAR